MGRSRKSPQLSKDQIEAFLEGVRRGLDTGIAAARVGLTDREFLEVLKQAETATSGWWKDLGEQIRKAKAEAIYTLHSIIFGHAGKKWQGRWQAAAWLLERRFPEYYAADYTERTKLSEEKPTEIVVSFRRTAKKEEDKE